MACCISSIRPLMNLVIINTLRPRQNCHHFADDIFKCIFLNENVWISLKISLKFVPTVQINNIPALVLIMAWRRPGDKPLSEPMMVISLTHICVTRPQWVNVDNGFVLNQWWPCSLIHMEITRLKRVDNSSDVDLSSVWSSDIHLRLRAISPQLSVTNIVFKVTDLKFNSNLPVANKLTHWGQVTHICIRKLTIIGSDNGLSPSRRQAII